MDLKQLLKNTTNKVKELWKTGKIQRSSRITYDVVWNVILFIGIIAFIGLFFGVGLGAGYFASLVKDEPILDYKTMKSDIYNYEETSKLYFAGNKYFADVNSDLHREKIKLKNVSKNLIDAVIATEDEHFREHKGVVPKAIVRAILQEAVNSNVKSGGSTLTQQLIKNQLLTNEVSFERKGKEILLALRLERFFTKDEILEAYLNIIPYGREASGKNIAGIQTAAKGIFGVDAKDLSLPQAAYLAGMPQNPYYYTPFSVGGKLKDKDGLKPGINRMKTVLKRMYNEKYITKDQYQKAIHYNIVKDFTKKSASPREKNPILSTELEERAKDILVKIIAKKDGHSMKELNKDKKLKEKYNMLAEQDLRQKGYKIYSTIDKDLYTKFQKVARDYAYYGPDAVVTVTDKNGKSKQITQKVQTGSVLIENKTGKILSFVGNRDYSRSNQLNYATAPRPNGSTMKPLLDYAPAMEKGIIQPGTPIADTPEPILFPGTSYSPHNYAGGYHGIVSARDALKNSYNIPAVKTYAKIINDNPAKEYLDKMGITTLEKGDYYYPSLSLGQPTRGITVEENTNAFATFGNNGKFVDAYMIEKITTSDGKIVYQHKSKPVKVFSPQTTYLTLDMMRDVIHSGTAAYIPSQLKYGGVDWAGKTGTSQDWKDAWFVGTNPNVTLGTWIGYRTPKSLLCSGCSLTYSQRVNKLWAELVNTATDENKKLMAPTHKFKQPDGIVHRSYCAVSGMLPSDLCSKAGLVKSDIFNAKYAPTKVDDSLIGGSFVQVNGRAVAAGPKTPKEFVNGNGLSFNPDFLKRNGYDRISDLTQLYPRIDRKKWEKIGFSKGQSTGSISDSGKAPTAPGGVQASGAISLGANQVAMLSVIGFTVHPAAVHPLAILVTQQAQAITFQINQVFIS
ncbi:transglycosylase domain-containing protein [Virgibacillus sp. 179-BFC.A HS]|uniref:Transglycosylase domain-containing protein n=1 Tax=Tigheibacillus jepli TaxID=3035914 RepID=A0ABU5CG69_9BACI|nr:transglycosylase domain-containing protein [Virgibacillus sp. 179-BFC.A HS]MDY0405319.1 transglycosylase domain-containing protein [Virgibacillus sp. 179-BFC.A HS]